MPQPKVLMVLTSHDQLGDTGHKTGFWLEEFATPYYVFVDAGAEITLASIQGGMPPLDPNSDAPDSHTETTRRFQADSAAQAQLQETIEIADLTADQIATYDAIFLPGGHGTMWDFPESECLTGLIADFHHEGKVVAAVCHAPAALVNVKTKDGTALVQGKTVTAFTDSEERAVQLETVVPFLLETRLRELGAKFESGPDFEPLAHRDGTLITGQNPASSAPAAQAVLQAISQPAD